MCSTLHGLHPFLHRLVICLKNFFVSVELVQLKWQCQYDIPPAKRTCIPLLYIISDLWYCSQHISIFQLIQANTAEPVFVKGCHILIIQCCCPIDHYISCPSCFFSCRTICRNRNVIRTLAPVNITLQLIDLLIRALEISCYFIFCTDCKSCEIFFLPICSTSHAHIAESMICKMWLKNFFPLLSANINILLCPACSGKNIEEVPLTVKHFSMFEFHFCADFFLNLYPDGSCKVLSKINHCFAIWCNKYALCRNFFKYLCQWTDLRFRYWIFHCMCSHLKPLFIIILYLGWLPVISSCIIGFT